MKSKAFEKIAPNVIKNLEKRNMEGYYVNTKEEALRMSKLGVDNIITDQPGYIRESLYETEQNRTIFELLKLVLH